MAEKLLTNWVSICLYAFLRVRAPLPSPHAGAAALGLPDLWPDPSQGPWTQGQGVGKGRVVNLSPGRVRSQACWCGPPSALAPHSRLPL